MNLSQDSTSHYGIPQGVSGRGGHQIVGIVLHALGVPLADYISFMHTALRLQDIRPGHPSVHYVVGQGIARQFIPDAQTAWGLQLHNSTWPLLGSYPGVNPNYLFVQVGLESFTFPPTTAMFNALAQLISYIAQNDNLTIDDTHVITHTALDDGYPQCDVLFPNLLATAQSLSNLPVLPNVVALSNQLTETDNELETLEASVANSLSLIQAQANHPSAIAGASLGHIESSSTIVVDPLTGVASVKQLNAAYAIGAPQSVAPSLPSIVNFSVVLIDQSPAWVTAGTFWHVVPPPNWYRLRARIQFENIAWTAGNTIHLDLYKNGVFYAPLGVRTIEVSQVADIELGGEYPILANGADSYDVRCTQTNIATRQIVNGVIQVERT